MVTIFLLKSIIDRSKTNWDLIALHKRDRVINSDGFLYSHKNGKLVNSCLFWIELNLKVINFLCLYYEFKFFCINLNFFWRSLLTRIHCFIILLHPHLIQLNSHLTNAHAMLISVYLELWLQETVKNRSV